MADNPLLFQKKKYYIIETVCTILKEEYTMQISKDMSIGALIQMVMIALHPSILMRAGMHCLSGCPASRVSL